jgi:hypothetical protein
VVQLALHRWVDIERSFGRKPNPALVSVCTTGASSDVVNLLGSVGWDASYLVFDFPGDNLSPALRRGGDSCFDVISFLEAPPWKSCGPASPVDERLGKRLKF